MDLFSPVSLGDLHLPNRVVMAPLTRMRSGAAGVPGDLVAEHYAQRASVGLIITEGTYPSHESRAYPGQPGIVTDEQVEGWRRVADAVHARGGRIVMQLMNGGRVSHPEITGTDRIVAPSAIAIDGEVHTATGKRPYPVPHALTTDELAVVRDEFVAAARNAIAAGLDGVEIHSANGYLLHQFLSPLANQRGDAYGGSAQARMRFPLEVFDAVRQAVPDSVPVGVRVSATDWVEGGLDLEQTIAFALELKSRGCAWIDVSSGGVSPRQRIALGPGYQVHLAQAVRESTGLPTMAVGLITEPQQAEDIVREGRADMVALARAMLWDPRWPWHAAAALGASVEVPPQYWRSEPRDARGVFAHASVGQR